MRARLCARVRMHMPDYVLFYTHVSTSYRPLMIHSVPR